MEIPDNDFLFYVNIYVLNYFITKLIFVTKKGRELIVGNEEGEEKFNIILGFMGGYRNCLELISCTYINFDVYYRNV